MPDERSLLERLSRPKAGASPTMTENPLETNRSILRNLQRILNTRLGQAPAQMDMGMPPPSDIVQASPDARALILRNLRTCIEKYEPRLGTVEITHVESEHDVLTLRFQVTARLSKARSGRTLSFETVVDPRGHFRLHG
jgi:type VI secretion system protein